MFTRNTELKLAAMLVVSLLPWTTACSGDEDLGDHTHGAEDIYWGKLDNERLNMGPGGGLDADRLDGLDSTDFSLADHTHSGDGHTHDGEDISAGRIDNARLNMGHGGGLDADLFDGQDSSDFATASHGHAPVVWVGGATTAMSCDGVNAATYLLNHVETDTAAGYVSASVSGTITIEAPGIYRVRAWSMTGCGSADISSAGVSTADQSVLKNEVVVARASSSTPVAKLDSTYLGSCAVGDTFRVEYGCNLAPAAPIGCTGYSSFVGGGSGIQVQYLGALQP